MRPRRGLVEFAHVARQFDGCTGAGIGGGERGVHVRVMRHHGIGLQLLRADAVDRLSRREFGAKHEVVEVEHKLRAVVADNELDPVHRVRPCRAPDDDDGGGADFVHPARRLLDRHPRGVPARPRRRFRGAHHAIDMARRSGLARDEDHAVGDDAGRGGRRWRGFGRGRLDAPTQQSDGLQAAAHAAPQRPLDRPRQAQRHRADRRHHPPQRGVQQPVPLERQLGDGLAQNGKLVGRRQRRVVALAFWRIQHGRFISLGPGKPQGCRWRGPAGIVRQGDRQ